MEACKRGTNGEGNAIRPSISMKGGWGKRVTVSVLPHRRESKKKAGLYLTPTLREH